jgi:gamma-glutamyltranspeptidase/glutathione hydrolase
MRDLQRPGRAPVHATGAMACTSHYLASLGALDMLRAGGTAIDAAVAACAVQCVVEPGSTGLGGDCFALYAPAGASRPVALNGSSRAPAGADPAALRAAGHTAMPRQSPHAVLIPGAVAGWARLLADHGRLGLERVLQPAIRLAEDGYPIYQRTAFDFERERAVLAADPHCAEVFLQDGRPPREGELHRQPKLAQTLRAVARHGPDVFYTGWIGEDLVARLQDLGGAHTLDDFAAMAETGPQYVEPIRTGYRGRQIYECPPNGQGVIALELLNVLSGLEPVAGDPLSADRLHLHLEAARLGYADRDAVLADPDTGVPVDTLLSAAHAEAQRARIDPACAMAPPPRSPLAAHRDTVYITVVDADGNAASFINSLFNHFGSGLVGPESGVVLNNRGCGFSLDPKHPNALAPNKRPLHTIIPAMAFRDDRLELSFGVMGGHYQAAGHAWFLSNLYDHGLDLQAAVDLPRAFLAMDGPAVQLERGIPADAAAELARRGHETQEAPAPIGGAQAIRVDRETGVLTGASDPRKDGFALGY